MYRYIKSHSYLDYNVNPRGTNTGDCQTRAIAMALGLSWDEVRKRLRAYGHDSFRHTVVFENALSEVFNCEKIPFSDECTVGEFCDTTTGQHGTYLVLCGDKNKDYANHVVCIIDGTIYDTWDSSRLQVKGVYKPTGDYVTEGIKVESDLPDRIYKVAFSYVDAFNDYAHDADFVTKVREAIPSIDEATLDEIDKRLHFSATVDYDKVHSFNFVLDITGYCHFGGIKLKKKSYNITFATDESFDDAMAKMPATIASLYDKYSSLLINQFKLRLGDEVDTSNLLNSRISQTLLNAYKKIDADIRPLVVNMETFCGYTSAIFRINPENPLAQYVMVMVKSAGYLSEGIRICMKQGSAYWDDYHTAKVNILPHGFAFNMRKYWYTYTDDKRDFQEFMENYEDYLYDQEQGIDHGLDYHFSQWKMPDILT